MTKVSNKKLTVICIVLVVALFLSIVGNVVIHNENSKLKNEQIKQMTTEWSEVYELSRQVDNYIALNYVDGENYQKYVNKICHHFKLASPVSQLNWNMSDLLVNSYDPLFSNLIDEERTVNKKKAVALLKEMNSSLAEISKNISEMSTDDKNKLMDQSSTVYKQESAKVIDFSIKYQKLTDDYFKGL